MCPRLLLVAALRLVRSRGGASPLCSLLHRLQCCAQWLSPLRRPQCRAQWAWALGEAHLLVLAALRVLWAVALHLRSPVRRYH